jgi:hypothetical protein
LSNAVELIRVLIGAHQLAIAIIVQEDWSSIRKFFSLSEKYAAWAKSDTPATGYGMHGWLLRHNQPVRMTPAELEAHPEWKGFGNDVSVSIRPCKGGLLRRLSGKMEQIGNYYNCPISTKRSLRRRMRNTSSALRS